MKLAILFLFITTAAFSQNYEYAYIWTVSIGASGEDKADFYFSGNDSAKFYKQMRLPHITKAIAVLDSKGWELITINNQIQSGKNLLSAAYMRRKKK